MPNLAEPYLLNKHSINCMSTDSLFIKNNMANVSYIIQQLMAGIPVAIKEKIYTTTDIHVFFSSYVLHDQRV